MRRESTGPVLPSLLDRLTDRDPKVRSEAPAAQAQTVRQLHDSLRRDLEWLLNTRRTPDEAPASSTELRRSVYSYGLPDFTNYTMRTSEDRYRLGRIMELAIANFEPRLTNIIVTVQDQAQTSRVLHFHIEALLRVDPAPERVFFDARLELSSSSYKIEGETPRA
jgi:type VI secretion system protein ImpF